MNRTRRSKTFRAFAGGAILLALAFAAPAWAAVDSWTPLGPGGGTVQSLAVDPRDPGVVYAVVGPLDGEPGTLYKSLDGGATWRTLAAGSGLHAVALDPEHPGTVFAGGSYILRSTNGGRTWGDVSPPLENTRIAVLAVAPGGVVFAGDRGGLLRSPDGGRTWAVVSQDDADIQTILVDPTDPHRIYHASAIRLYKSEDGGVQWTLLPGAYDNSGIALAPSVPDTLYDLSAFDTRVYRTDDGGTTWRMVGQVPRATGVQVSLLVDARSPDLLYAASETGLFTSADGGSTWRETATGLPRPLGQPLAMTVLAAAPSRPATLYAGTEEMGVARSTDAGAHWRIGVETGLNAADPHLLRFHPLRPDTLYLGQGALGTRSFRSTDGGRTWQGFARAITQQGWNDLAFDLQDPDLLYAATGVAIWKSTDGGDSWTRISGQISGRLVALGGQTLLASPANLCGLDRSTDGGLTWRSEIPCHKANGDFRTLRSVWVDPRDSRHVYVHFFFEGGTHDFGYEVFQSRDGGATWTQLPRLFPTLFAVAPGDFHVLYAVDENDNFDSRLMQSLDGGDHWKVVNRNLPSPLGGLFPSGSLVVDAADPSKLYVAASPLLISRNGGATFQEIDTPFEAGKLGKRDTTRIWTDLTHPGLVYAGALGGGLFAGHFE